mmetsp:Transcript_23076/g.56049  ORF Transcript_23076/g.56049 Transcript_23076/m.56049 type:complete len:207 (+) Transcript_23076:41-661(+)
MTCAAPAVCTAAFEDGEFVIRQGRKNKVYYPPAKVSFKRTVTGDKLAPGSVSLRSGFDDMMKMSEPSKAENAVAPVVPTERPSCPSGANCYIADSAHKARFAHNGDEDYKPRALMAGGKRRSEDDVISHKADWHLFGKRAIWEAFQTELADIPDADSPVRLRRKSHDGVSATPMAKAPMAKELPKDRSNCMPCGFVADDDDRPWYF